MKNAAPDQNGHLFKGVLEEFRSQELDKRKQLNSKNRTVILTSKQSSNLPISVLF